MEESKGRYREYGNQIYIIITYKIGDMVMVRVQVQRNKATGVLGKMSIQSRGMYKIIVNHNNRHYCAQTFDKPGAAIRKFLSQYMYALPPQILP